MSKTIERDPSQFPFASEFVTNRQGTISKVSLRFQDYQALLSALEDAGLYRAMKESAKEKPLSREEALLLLRAK